MKKAQKNWLEWSVFAASTALIVALIGFLIYESLTIGNAPPDIQLEVGTPEQRSGYFAVSINATNKGDHTAEGVHIEVVLRGAGKEETGDFEIAFLPRRGSREAWVTFKDDPRKGSLEARVLGYEKP
ncbi:MAG TPA: hypothetical protein VK993_16550 [Chthoniobacterales bacterium]|nr:hypothetical protein [Chthoniobacterales bacterium]